MKKRRFSEEQIIGILKQGKAVVKKVERCGDHVISAMTLLDGKRKLGGMGRERGAHY